MNSISFDNTTKASLCQGAFLQISFSLQQQQQQQHDYHTKNSQKFSSFLQATLKVRKQLQHHACHVHAGFFVLKS